MKIIDTISTNVGLLYSTNLHFQEEGYMMLHDLENIWDFIANSEGSIYEIYADDAIPGHDNFYKATSIKIGRTYRMYSLSDWKELIDKGMRVYGMCSNSPLCYVATHGELDLLTFLLDLLDQVLESEIERWCDDEWHQAILDTALGSVANYPLDSKRAETMELLVQRGADPSGFNNRYISWAMNHVRERVDIVHKLIALGGSTEYLSDEAMRILNIPQNSDV